MNRIRIRRSIALWILTVVLGLIAPGVSRADVGLVLTLGLHAPRVARILGVIEDGPDPITTTLPLGVAGRPAPHTARELGIIDESPDPINQRPSMVPVITRSATRSRTTSR